MKIYIILITLTILLSGCLTPITKSEFSDRAELRRFKVETTTQKTSSGYLFFFVGQYSSSENSISKIKFYAKNKNDEYCLFEVNSSDVKIKLDSTITNAYVTFKFHENLFSGKETAGIAIDSLSFDNIKYFLNTSTLIKAIITCNPKDFPENINLDQL